MTTYKSDLSSSNNTTKFFTNDNEKRNLYSPNKQKFQENTNLYPERDIFNINDEKCIQLKKLYDERVNSLYNNIKIIANKFENDEILNTMKNDSISNEFINQRVREIIDINLTKEKEELLKKLSEELAEWRVKMPQKDHIINELKNNHKLISEDYERKFNQIQEAMSSDFHKYKLIEDQNKTLQNQIESLHKNYDFDVRKNMDDLINKNGRIMNEFQNLQNEYDNAIEHIKVILFFKIIFRGMRTLIGKTKIFELKLIG